MTFVTSRLSIPGAKIAACRSSLIRPEPNEAKGSAALAVPLMIAAESMSEPLRIGIAGLGTVGAAVVGLLDRQREALASRTGRSIVVAGVSARDRDKERGFDLGRHDWVDDPVALARIRPTSISSSR